MMFDLFEERPSYPGFEDDLFMMIQLVEQRQRDPKATISLVAVLERMLARLEGEKTPMLFASIQSLLGNAYYALPVEDHDVYAIKAISCFKEALRYLTPERAPLQYASVQNNLGNAYHELTTGDLIANQEQAITCYQEALRFRRPETAPYDFAHTKSNLGEAYHRRLAGDHTDNLKQAMACFNEALRFLTPEDAPFDYALIQDNLGSVYCGLSEGDPTKADVAKGIVCFHEALRFLSPETSPIDYALAQANMGKAYCDLPTGDRAVNFTYAIKCYQEALRFLTPKTAPQDYARTQWKLGIVYGELQTGDRKANLEQAIACYQKALHFLTPESDPLGYAHAKFSLGEAYHRRLEGDHADNLKQAVDCFNEDLRFYKPEFGHISYALIQNNLGTVYNDLSRIQNSLGTIHNDLEQAITHYQEALRFLTLQDTPFYYALVQSNLGIAYHNLGSAYNKLPTGDRNANLEQAIACYKEALRFQTPEVDPEGCRMTSFNLANLYFGRREWQLALGAYEAAMEAGERLYRSGLSLESKATQITENSTLYHHAAFAAVQCKKNSQALTILEQGKTRLLAEVLRLHAERPPYVPDEIWSEFEQAATAMRTVQIRKSLSKMEESDPLQDYEARMQAARDVSARLDAAIERVQTYAPYFLKAIDFPTIQAQLSDEHTALIAFCITEQGSIGFVVSQHNPEAQVIKIPFTQADLRRLLGELDMEGQPSDGWLVAYYHYLAEQTTAAFEIWRTTITRVLAELGRLLTPILSTLPAAIERLILLPSAELFLLPLHAVPLCGNASKLICDRYQISYVPSIEVLSDARAKVRQEMTPELYAVINPEDDPHLIFTSTEGAVIAKFLTPSQCTIDVGSVGTKERVLAGMKGRTYIHFSCHGSYSWDDPPDSGLDLADDRLSLADLQHGDADLSAAQLVTLSACETGITDVLQGRAEEYVGIPAGFLLAGVPCVVCSLWAVEDFSTALLMEDFYQRHLIQGQNIAQALQEAQHWLRTLARNEVMARVTRTYSMMKNRRQTDKKQVASDQLLLARLQGLEQALMEDYSPEECPFAHPYYWAAFLAAGAV